MSSNLTSINLRSGGDRRTAPDSRKFFSNFPENISFLMYNKKDSDTNPSEKRPMVTATFGSKFLSVEHKATCTIDYLTDHHNRDGEFLISVSMSSDPEIIGARWDVIDSILAEITYSELPDDFTFYVGKLLEKNVTEAVGQIHTSDLISQDDDEERQIFMLLAWGNA